MKRYVVTLEKSEREGAVGYHDQGLAPVAEGGSTR